MYRKVIANGDLVQLKPTWFGFGPWEMHRNLSEEVRLLQELEDKAKAKYIDLAHKSVIASTNIADELETLQILLLENSEAYFEVGVDNSILEKREGVRYNFNRGNNNKQGASSNKDKQNQNQNKDNGSNGHGDGDKKGNRKVLSMSDLLSAKLVLH